MTNDTKRADYVAGLRQLADIIESTPELPLPTHADTKWLLFADADLAAQKAEAARIVRLMPGPARKWETSDLFRFGGYLHGLEWQVVVDRPAVCERVVTDAQVVTREVPDPDFTVPTVTVTETVETIEWRCAPLLADLPAS